MFLLQERERTFFVPRCFSPDARCCLSAPPDAQQCGWKRQKWSGARACGCCCPGARGPMRVRPERNPCHPTRRGRQPHPPRAQRSCRAAAQGQIFWQRTYPSSHSHGCTGSVGSHSRSSAHAFEAFHLSLPCNLFSGRCTLPHLQQLLPCAAPG